MLFKGLPALIAGLALTVSARATVVYTFIYTATDGPFPSTTFQLDEPTYLSVGDYAVTPPLTMLLGSIDYSFTQLYVGTQDGDAVCFSLATPTASVGNCTAGTTGNVGPNADFFVSYPATDPPSAPGTFGGADSAAAITAVTGSSGQTGGGTVVLDVTLTPEPPTALLAGWSLLVCVTLAVLGRRLRNARENQPWDLRRRDDQ